MKHKWLTVLLALVAAVCLCFGLAACGGNGGNGGGGAIGDGGGSGSGGDGSCQHQYTADNVCALCGDKWEYTEGLNYVYDEETDTYTVGRNFNANASGDVILPYGHQGKFVTKIGEEAFSGYDDFVWHSELTSITIPDCVTEIERDAFRGCNGLTRITIPDCVTKIEEGAFRDCDGLTRVDISDLAAWCKIDFGGEYANPLGYAHHLYLDGEEVTTLTIPKEITEIKPSTFEGCSGLTSVIISEGATSIGDYAFYECSGLTNVTIPDSVTSIGQEAFAYCEGLTSVTIGSGVTSIGEGAFWDCSGLTSITIPDNVTSIGYRAFDGTAYYNDASHWENGEALYIGNHLIEVKSTVSGAFTIRPGTKTIVGGVFEYCDGLTSVTIPDSVTVIGSSAFSGCANLESITVDEGNQNYSSQDGILYNKAKTEFIHISKAVKGAVTIPDGMTVIGSKTFRNCTGLTGVTIPDGVTKIEGYAFGDCTGLTSVTIGSGVTEIGQYAFSGCGGLTSVTIPDSVTSIGQYAFYDCDGLTSVTIGSGVTEIGQHAFSGRYGLTRVDITDLVAWCKIDFVGQEANPLTYAHHLYLDGEEVTTLTIPEEITEIKDYAFSGCTGLTSVTIPNNVTSIGYEAFQYCSGLTSVIIGSGVTSIGYMAFYGCTKLTDIQFKGTVAEWQEIGKDGDWDMSTGHYTVTCTDGKIDWWGDVTYFE